MCGLMKYRSRIGIIAMILDSIGSGSKKTRIMYGAHLSYKQTNEYLAVLLERGLIKSEDGVFTLTPNGRQAIESIGEVEKLVGMFGRRREEFERNGRFPAEPEVVQ